jgi:hypothetical protein
MALLTTSSAAVQLPRHQTEACAEAWCSEAVEAGVYIFEDYPPA